MAGYVFSNKTLREELSNAKDADAAGKILAKHLKQDGKQIGKEIKEFVDSEEVQSKFKEARTYVKENVKKAKEDLKGMVQKEKSSSPKAAKPAFKKSSVNKKKVPAKKTDTVA